MKNTFYKLAFTLLLTFLLQSCSKDIINEESQGETMSFKSKNDFLDIKIINNPYDTKTYIINPEDTDDEKIQNQLLNLGYLSRDLFKTNKYNSIIFDKASQNRNNTISFSDLIFNVQEKDKADILRKFIDGIDLTHKSQNPNSNEIENYIPAIFVPNIDNADFNLQPIISSGIIVNCNLDDLKDYEDYIVAWYFDNGKWFEFLLNEEMANETKHPVFIVDNAEKEMTYSKRTDYITINNNTKNSATNYSTQHYSHRYIINSHHETWAGGRSELYITAAAIYDDGSTRLTLLKGNNYRTRKRLANVKRSWVGHWRWQYQQFCNTDNYSGNKKVYWNTYERDWNRSYKNLGEATNFGVTIQLEGRMGRSGDYYAYRPSTIQMHPFNLNIVSSYVANNSRGGYLIENQ